MKEKKVTTIYQRTPTECGAASLAMILAYHGRQIPMEIICHETNISRDGCTAGDILRAGRHYGLECHGYRLEIKKLKAASFPCIIFWESRHFVVLESMDDNGAVVHDPEAGKCHIPLEEFETKYANIAITFQCPEEWKADETKRSYRKPWQRAHSKIHKEEQSTFSYSKNSYFFGFGLHAGIELQACCLDFDGKRLFDNLNVSLLPGELVQIIGGEGTGVTSLCRLMAGRITPQSGNVVIPSKEQIQYLPERPWLPEGNVLDILRGNATWLPMTEVERVIQAVMLQETIKKHPRGYATEIRQGECPFSTSELRRLALARALLQYPTVLVMDGLFSCMENDLAEVILSNLRREGIICVIGSHMEHVFSCTDAVISLPTGVLSRRHPIAGNPQPDVLEQHLLPWETVLMPMIGDIQVREGAVDVFLVPVENASCGERCFLFSCGGGETIPAFYETDQDGRLWRFLFQAREESLLRYLERKNELRSFLEKKTNSSIDPEETTLGYLKDRYFQKLLYREALAGLTAKQQEIPQWKRIRPGTRTAARDVSTNDNCRGIFGQINVEGVAYLPAGRQTPIFQDISIMARRGELICVTGKAGSGKSTLCRLFSRELLPTAGKVSFLDSNGGAAVPVVAIVSPEDAIRNGSILDNIIGESSDNRAEDRLIRAIHCSGMEEELKRLPMGINTLLQPEQYPMPELLRRKILLARGMYQSPDMVLLDGFLDGISVGGRMQLESMVAALPMLRFVLVAGDCLTLPFDRRYVLWNNTLRDLGKERRFLCKP